MFKSMLLAGAVVLMVALVSVEAAPTFEESEAMKGAFSAGYEAFEGVPNKPEQTRIQLESDEVTVIKNLSTSKAMVDTAIDLARKAFKGITNITEITKHIKYGMDEQFGGHWQCIVGPNFNAFVTGESLAFRLGQMKVLLVRMNNKLN